MKHENRIIKLTQKNYKIIQHHTTKKIFNKIIKQKKVGATPGDKAGTRASEPGDEWSAIGELLSTLRAVS